MEPSGSTFRVQFDGQSVVPVALGKVILVEFANVAALINPCLRCPKVCSRLTRIRVCRRCTERYDNNEITSKSKREKVGQHRDFRLAVMTV